MVLVCLEEVIWRHLWCLKIIRQYSAVSYAVRCLCAIAGADLPTIVRRKPGYLLDAVRPWHTDPLELAAIFTC